MYIRVFTHTLNFLRLVGKQGLIAILNLISSTCILPVFLSIPTFYSRIR